MKKLFVAVALVMSLGTTVAMAEDVKKNAVETCVKANEFKPIETKDLPAAVQEAINKNYAGSTIKQAEVEAKEDGTKTYKIVMTDQNGTESTVMFNEKGEVLK